jgi:type IV fimbrial biogenesis protein FimT
MLNAKNFTTTFLRQPVLRNSAEFQRWTTCGFTMIELMVTITVVAILLVIAVPSLRSFIQKNRIVGEASSFVSDLQYARSEAIKRGLPVAICASSDGINCSTTNTWHQGWIVFCDADTSGSVSLGDTTLRTRKQFLTGDTLVANPSVLIISINRDGIVNNLPASATEVVMQLHTAAPVNTSATRCVAISRTGRSIVQDGGTGNCT